MFLLISEARVERLGRLDDLLEKCPVSVMCVRPSQSGGPSATTCHSAPFAVREGARFPPSLTANQTAPKAFLVGGQPKTGLHAFELGFNSRLRPALHELGVLGCLSPCRSGGGEIKSGEGGCRRHGGKRPKESAFHEDASSERFFLERCMPGSSAVCITAAITTASPSRRPRGPPRMRAWAESGQAPSKVAARPGHRRAI